MSDRELLEMAAKAAGIRWQDWTKMVPNEHYPEWWPYDWNPLTDDGDALRLAVKLHLKVKVQKFGYASVSGGISFDPDQHPKTTHWERAVSFGTSAEAATRRAIVSVAAAIGKAMP